MQTVTLEEAQSHLAEIIEKLPPGEEIVLEGLLAKQGSNICSTRVVKSKDGRTLLSQSEQR